MTLDQFMCIYFFGAVVTGLSCSTERHSYLRCVLLWPLLWVVILLLFVRAMIDEALK